MGYSCNIVLNSNWWVGDTGGYIYVWCKDMCISYSIIIQSGLGVKLNMLGIHYPSCKPYSCIKLLASCRNVSKLSRPSSYVISISYMILIHMNGFLVSDINNCFPRRHINIFCIRTYFLTSNLDWMRI